MKVLLLLLVTLFAVGHFSFAQLSLVNTSLINADSNTVFVGVENIFEIRNPVKGSYQLTSSNASSIERTNTPNTFNVHPVQPGVDTLSIIQNGSTIYQKIFANKFLPMPIATLDAIPQNAATKDQLISSGRLIVLIDNFKGKTDYTIVSFKLNISSTHISDADHNILVAGNLLSEKALAVIKLLQPGDSIQFDNIKGRGTISSETIFPSFTIKVK